MTEAFQHVAKLGPKAQAIRLSIRYLAEVKFADFVGREFSCGH